MRAISKSIIKKAAAGLVCLASMTTMVVSAIPLAMSKASYNTLDTQTALASPLLNTTNFSTEDWNEYETICWGVFLSNFCQPLVDTYESAFRSDTSYGSMGKGYNALWGGSGSDASNAGIIKALCDYAIEHQLQVNEQIYVGYTYMDGYGNYTLPEESSITDDNVREASFRDLWFYGDDDKYGDDSYTKDQCTYVLFQEGEKWSLSTSTYLVTSGDLGGQYDDTAIPNKACLPTFYVKRDDHYITVLDYTDWWDCQIMSWMSNALRHDEKNISDQFKSNFETMWEEDSPITLDSFGNILTNTGGKSYMTVPGAVNQNLTGEKVINTLNSWMMNNYVNTYSNEQVALGVRQNLNTFAAGGDGIEENIFTGEVFNGFPAFGWSTIGNIGLFYYDLDSLYEYEFLKYGANGDYTFGDKLLKLMDQSIDNDKTSLDVPLKFELSGNGAGTSGHGFPWIFAGDEVTGATPMGIYTSTLYAAGMLANMNFVKQKETEGLATSKFQKTILHEILKPSGDRVNLFTDKGVMIPVKAKISSLGAEKKDPTNEGALRLFYNYLYDRYQNTTNHSKTNKDSITRYLKGTSSDKFFGECEQFLISDFIDSYSAIDYSDADIIQGDDWFGLEFDYGNNEAVNTRNTTRCVIAYPASDVMQAVSSVLSIKDGAEFSTYCNYIYMTYLDFYGIQGSETLTNGVQNNSKFDNNIFNSDQRKSVLITDVAKEVYAYEGDFASNIDIEEANLQYGYLMLSPEDGRDYRKQIIEGTIADFMYEQYNKVVYGGASEYSGSASKAKSGFFYVPAYSENPITSFFIDYYTDIVAVLILISILVIILFGLLKKKKVTWFLISSVVAINTFLLVPSSGDIVPYITSKAVNSMFRDSMTFWSLSAGITNSELENDAFKKQRTFENMSDEDAKLVLGLVSELSVVQTDGSLAVKQDISQKITQYVAEGVYSNIESYQSARWILPMVMQQFSANTEEDVTKFIYKPIANIWTDLSNMYWYFAPIDAEITDGVSHTLTSGQGGDMPCANYKNVEEALSVIQKNNTMSADDTGFNDDVITAVDEKTLENNKKQNKQVYDKFQIYENLNEYYPDAIKMVDRYDGTTVKLDSDTSSTENEQHVNYRCYSYSAKDPARQVHLISTYLEDKVRVPISRKSVFGLHGEDYKDADSWQAYIDASKKQIKNIGSWMTNYKDEGSTFKGFEFTSDAYKRDDRGTISSDLPYLWSTEQPIYYFYSVVKDTFNYDDNLGKLIYHLQGRTSLGGDVPKSEGSASEISNLLESLDDEDVIRNNFMYATITTGNETEVDIDSDRESMIPTGKVRDVLDLEELFGNAIPYLYQMSITANGFDGVSGILGDNRMSDESEYYEGELQSWMYRCNWATKVMENPSFSEPLTVRDADGKKYTVNNPLLAECYPKNRPMVFSEAQEYALGLEDRDLNIVELKCCELNRKVARSWTLLLNYAGTPGITREVLLRQMATDATLLFSQEFSSSGIVDTKYELYPSSLDLRYTSFDSIMKQLMLNVSRDTSYIYGDTMATVLSHSDMFTGVLLLIATYLCAMIAPFGRVVLLASVFYLGFLAILRGLMYSRGTKMKMACGQIITNLLFMAYTLAYFLVFKLLMALTNSDQVLNVNRMSSELGSPTWLVIVIILVTLLYLVALGIHIKFCYSTCSDMGYSAYSQLATGIVGSIKDTAGRVKNNFTNLFSEKSENNSSYSSESTASLSGANISSGDSGDMNSNSGIDLSNSASAINADGNSQQTLHITSGQIERLPNSTTNNNIYDNDIELSRADYSTEVTNNADDNSISSTEIDAIIDQGAAMDESSGTFNPYE
jgi:hypothetical protein